MINANELRIGNVVSDINASISYYAKVKRLEANRCYYGAFHSQYNDLTPIPITKEWLLAFGLFETHSYYIIELTDNRYDKKDFFTVRVQGDKYEAFLRNWDLAKLFLLCEIKYIHQLQNLYFALTQTELELKS